MRTTNCLLIFLWENINADRLKHNTTGQPNYNMKILHTHIQYSSSPYAAVPNLRIIGYLSGVISKNKRPDWKDFKA